MAWDGIIPSRAGALRFHGGPRDRDTPVRNQSVPTPAVQRLSLYLRRLEELANEDVEKVSSQTLANSLRITAAQLRKDLAYFGQFGRPGVGYRVGPLIGELRSILGTDHTWKVVLVGVGDLGRALLRYRGFRKKGFELVAAFDISPRKIGRRVGKVVIRSDDELAQVVRKNNVKLAVIATPAESAQKVAELLCGAGIKGILNFARTTLQIPPDIAINPVDLAATLEHLSFQIHSAG